MLARLTHNPSDPNVRNDPVVLMDHCVISASAFDKQADLYRKKFMDLTMYDDSYREFCDLLTPGRARVLDAACGPGNVSRYLMAQGLIWICWALISHRAWWSWPAKQFPRLSSRCMTAGIYSTFNGVSTGSSVPLACRTSYRKK